MNEKYFINKLLDVDNGGQPASGGGEATNPVPAPTPAPAPESAPAAPAPAPAAPQFSVSLPETHKDILGPIADEFKAAGLTSAQAQGLIDKAARDLEGRASALKAENATLQAKYGAETENVKKEAIAAMQKLGFTLEDASKLTSSLGLANAIDKFYELSKQTKSGAVPNPQTDGTIDYSGITAAEAAKRLEALDKDKVFAERLAKGDILAKNEIKRLIAIKNGVSVNAEGKYV